MTADLPLDNPKRMEYAPLMALVSHASRLATFNKALNLAERDFSAWPVDFVEAVLVWARETDH